MDILSTPIFIYFILILCVVLGLAAEKLKYLQFLSSAVVILFSASLFSNLGIIPSESEYYDLVYEYFVPISIPLFLMNANFKKIHEEADKMLIIFLFATLGTIIGGFFCLAFLIFSEEAYKLIAMLTGSYIGGSTNYVAISKILELHNKNLFLAGTLIDNVVMVVYFIILGITGKSKFVKSKLGPYTERYAKNSNYFYIKEIDSFVIVKTFLLSFGILTFSKLCASLINFPSFEIIFVTFFALCFANIFPKQAQSLDNVKPIAQILLYIFLAVIGAGCNLSYAKENTYSILLIAIIILSFQYVFCLIGARHHKVSPEETIIAANAAAGGAATAAAMASANKNYQLVGPAILCGTLGYAIATFIATAMAYIYKIMA